MLILRFGISPWFGSAETPPMVAARGIFICNLEEPQGVVNSRGECWIQGGGGPCMMHLIIRGNKRVEMQGPRGCWSFRSNWLLWRHHLVPRFKTRPRHWAFSLGFPRLGGTGLCLRDGGYGARSAQKDSANESAGRREFQRAGRPVPFSGKLNLTT